MKFNWQIFILAFLLILMAVIFTVSFQFPYVQAKLAPMTITGLLIILIGVQILREYGSSRRSREEDDSLEAPVQDRESIRPYFLQGLWMIGFFVAIACLGFMVAIPLFGIAYMRTQGTSWRKSVFISLVTLIIIYALFDRILDVDLYAGWIPGLLIG